MRVLEGSNRVRNGLMGILIVILVIGVGQSFASVPMLFATPTYYAEFSDTGGLNNGDKVRIAGVDVGTVRSMDIDGDKVVIGYALGGTQIGKDSRAAIRTDTILGRRNIEIEPRGTEVLQPGGTLPLGQTTTPYQIYDAFFDVSSNTSGWDTQTVKESLNVLSETIDQTYPHLSAALDGVARFSDTIGKRDDQIQKLLANANKVAGVLGNRGGQINELLVNAQTLLAAINERNYAVGQLLERVGTFSTQVRGVIDDNPNLNRVLEQLRTISGVLSERRMDLSDTLTSLSKFIVSLGEALASGPYFKVMLANLAPYWLLQPLRRRRLQEARHRSGGVLGQRRTAGLPLPGSQRHRVLQRRPAARPDPAGRHPGQSRAGRRPRIAVLLHPGPRRRPDPGQPAALRGPDRRAVRRQPVRTELRRAGSQRGHVGAQRPRTAAVPGCARLGDPRSAGPDRSRPAGAAAAGPARSPHRSARAAALGAGLHPGHRAAAPRSRRAPAATRARPDTAAGR